MNRNSLRFAEPGSSSPGNPVLQSLEMPLHSGNKRKVLDSIERLGLQVTPGKVATESGLPVLVCTALLNQIAYETQGQLQVDAAGQIAYRFPPAFQMNYLVGSSKNVFKTGYRVCLNAMAILIRIATGLLITLTRAAIGVALVLSVVLVVVLILLLLVVSILRFFEFFAGGDSGGGDVGDVGSGFNLDWLGSVRWFAIDWLWDWYYWDWFYSPYWHHDAPTAGSGTAYGGTPAIESDFKYDAPPVRTTEKSFIDCCCAMLLGVGDPNQQAKEQQWALIARVIKARGGVVTAEDLAPYMEIGDRPNEDWVLPVLIRFNGSPEVTQSGQLVYCFPTLVPENVISSPTSDPEPAKDTPSARHDALNNLVHSHLNRVNAHRYAETHTQTLPPYLAMQTVPVCGLTEAEGMKVIGFASIAGGGAIGLLCLAPQLAMIYHLQPLLWGIAAYGGLFFLTPLLRWCILETQNQKINQEENRRMAAADRLQEPDDELRRKMQEAEAIRAGFWASNTGVVYTTEKDLLEQQFAR